MSLPRRRLLAMAAGTGLALAAPALAYPSRPVRIIVPFAAGGGLDVQVRALARAMTPHLPGASIVVENRPGASSKIGTAEVQRAQPDGHTLVAMPEVSWVGYLHSGILDSRVWEELTPIIGYAETPWNLLQVKKDAGFDSWASLRDWARQPGRRLALGGSAAGGMTQLAGLDLLRRGQVDGDYVPFNGAAPALQQLLAGTLQAQLLPFGDGIANIRNGLTTGLAVSSAGRFPLAPEIPTFEELGIGDSVLITYSLWGPPGLPGEITSRLAQAVEAALPDPAFAEFMEQRQGFIRKLRSAEQVRQDIAAFDRKWGERLAAAKG